MTNLSLTPQLGDLLTHFSAEVYREAYQQGRSLSAHLETLYPSEATDQLDAFERVLAVGGIRTHSDFSAGLYASTMGDLLDKPNTRALVPELMRRFWVKATTAKGPSTRNLYTGYESTVGSWERPWAAASDIRDQNKIQAAIPTDSLIALNSPVNGDVYRAYYLTPSAADSRMHRVGAGAEIPTLKLTAAERPVQLYKYGAGLAATYEQLRRQSIDKIALHVAMIAVQAEVDKVSTIIDIAINGDGNAGTAGTEYDITSIDSAATANLVTLKGWLGFKMKFQSPYSMTVALCREDVALQLLLLSTTGSVVPLVSLPSDQFGGFSQINPNLRGSVGLGWTNDVPAYKILAMDTRMAIERVIEIGGNVSEVQRFASNQTETLYLTEVEGYAILDPGAIKILDSEN